MYKYTEKDTQINIRAIPSKLVNVGYSYFDCSDLCYLSASCHASCKRNIHQAAMNIGTLEYEPIKLEEKSEKSKVKLEEVRVPARLRERLFQ